MGHVQVLEYRLNVRQKDQFLNFYLLVTFSWPSSAFSSTDRMVIDTEERIYPGRGEGKTGEG
jgi:hypothetical protein